MLREQQTNNMKEKELPATVLAAAEPVISLKELFSKRMSSKKG
jgi:hypothetical protein